MSKDEESCKTTESKEKRDERSGRMLDLFKAIKGQPLASFPVPPFTKWLNGRILQAERGDVTIELDVRPEMANPTGLLHGGMQSAILDDIIGMMTATLGYKGFLITIDTNVNFLGKVKVGETVRIRGRIVREGRTIVNAMAEIFDAAGNLVANASANLLITTHEPDYAKNLEIF